MATRVCTCTTIVGPITAEILPTGRMTSSGRTVMSRSSTTGGRMPCSLNRKVSTQLQCHLYMSR